MVDGDLECKLTDGWLEMQPFRMLNAMVSVMQDVGGAAARCRLPIDCFEVPFTGRS